MRARERALRRQSSTATPCLWPCRTPTGPHFSRPTGAPGPGHRPCCCSLIRLAGGIWPASRASPDPAPKWRLSLLTNLAGIHHRPTCMHDPHRIGSQKLMPARHLASTEPDLGRPVDTTNQVQAGDFLRLVPGHGLRAQGQVGHARQLPSCAARPLLLLRLARRDAPLLEPRCCCSRLCSPATCRAPAAPGGPLLLREDASRSCCSQIHICAPRAGVVGSCAAARCGLADVRRLWRLAVGRTARAVVCRPLLPLAGTQRRHPPRHARRAARQRRGGHRARRQRRRRARRGVRARARRRVREARRPRVAASRAQQGRLRPSRAHQRGAHRSPACRGRRRFRVGLCAHVVCPVCMRCAYVRPSAHVRARAIYTVRRHASAVGPLPAACLCICLYCT